MCDSGENMMIRVHKIKIFEMIFFGQFNDLSNFKNLQSSIFEF